MVPAMCGTLVRMRRCSSASLESGTARKRDSAACSAAASRKPKMVVAGLEDAAALPLDRVDQPESNMADESNAAARIFMGSEVKDSKVAQVSRQARNARQAVARLA